MTEQTILERMDKMASAMQLMAAMLGTRLDRDQLADRLGIHRNTLATRLKTDNSFPRPARMASGYSVRLWSGSSAGNALGNVAGRGVEVCQRPAGARPAEHLAQIQDMQTLRKSCRSTMPRIVKSEPGQPGLATVLAEHRVQRLGLEPKHQVIIVAAHQLQRAPRRWRERHIARLAGFGLAGAGRMA